MVWSLLFIKVVAAFANSQTVPQVSVTVFVVVLFCFFCLNANEYLRNSGVVVLYMCVKLLQ